MIELLKLILSLSLSGSLLILVLLLGKPLYQNRFSKRWQYYIWLIVIARLLLPLSPTSSLMGDLFQRLDQSVIVKQSSPQLASMVTAADPLPARQADLKGGEQPPPAALGKGPEAAHKGAAILLAVWLIAAFGLFIRKVTLYQSFVRYITAGRQEIADFTLWEQLGELVEQAGVKKTVGLYTNSLIASPLLLGFLKPCIILPTAELPETDWQYTILHELTHCKRRDMAYKWLVQLTVCLHWFNPLVHVMAREINRACELSCDEAIIKNLDKPGQRAYGETLFNSLSRGGSYQSAAPSVTLSENAKLLKERLDAIMGYQKASRMKTALSAVLVLVLCFGAMITGAYAAILPPAEANKTMTTTLIDAKPPTLDHLTLVTKEYTLDELKTWAISGVVVEAFSENVSISRGGSTLKFEYYTSDQPDYTLQREDDSGKTRWNLCLARLAPVSDKEYGRSITITLPDELDLTFLSVCTDSGQIRLDNCEAKGVSVETKSGNVSINGGAAASWLKVQTINSHALIAQTALPQGDYAVILETRTGTIAFQPQSRAQDYHFVVSSAPKAQIVINEKTYAGGNYDLHPNAPQKIYFNSTSGSLLVQDKPTEGDLTSLLSPIDAAALPLVKKEYTENDPQQMGITGVRLEASTEVSAKRKRSQDDLL